jgi:hypothetical protein
MLILFLNNGTSLDFYSKNGEETERKILMSFLNEEKNVGIKVEDKKYWTNDKGPEGINNIQLFYDMKDVLRKGTKILEIKKEVMKSEEAFKRDFIGMADKLFSKYEGGIRDVPAEEIKQLLVSMTEEGEKRRDELKEMLKNLKL